MDEHEREMRARGLLSVLFLGFAAVVLTLVSLQVVRSEHFSSLARANRQFHTRVLAPRGVISDRNGVPLADNVYQARVTMARRRFKAEDPSFESLVELLGLDRDALLARMGRSQEPDRVTVVRHAVPEQIAKVEEHRAILPDVRLKVEPRRRYHFGNLAAHLLGYVGEVRSGETDARGRAGFYLPGDTIGRRGVEQLAEEQLRGRHGRKVVEVNAAGHIVGELPKGNIPVVPGVQLYLTLSQPLQAELERLLEGHTGAGVVLEVSTGDILAAASAPRFDPNEFTGGISQDRWDQLNEDPQTPLFNRIFQGTYPPGSPYKLISAAAGLETKKIRPSTRFKPCFGGYRLGNRVFRCWEPAGHGSLDLTGAIAQSCDVYFYQLGELLTLGELAASARRFGLGRPSGIELPGESAGLVPTADYYDERFGERGWTRGVLLNNVIGQGELLVTPLQMAQAYAALGGDGHLYRPSIILARENAFGVREVRQVHRVATPVCSDEVRRFLKGAMRSVVADEEGTGGLAKVRGVEVSGKTGTAENPHGDDHAWFVAYAPSDDPEVAVALIIENAGHGGSVAAPLVGELLEIYFAWKSETADAGLRSPGRRG